MAVRFAVSVLVLRFSCSSFFLPVCCSRSDCAVFRFFFALFGAASLGLAVVFIVVHCVGGVSCACRAQLGCGAGKTA